MGGVKMNFTTPVVFTCIVNRLRGGGGGINDQSSLKLPIIVQVKSTLLTYLIIFVTDRFFRSPPFCFVWLSGPASRAIASVSFLYLFVIWP